MEGSTVLPPCRICEDRSSGIHYGVYTCEACKAFFKRSVNKADVYECALDRSCDVRLEKRNSCAYCRVQKCFKMGMCKDAIRTGRYSHEMKACNIREVRSLKSQSRGHLMNARRDSNHDTTTLSGSDGDQSMLSPTDSYNVESPDCRNDTRIGFTDNCLNNPNRIYYSAENGLMSGDNVVLMTQEYSGNNQDTNTRDIQTVVNSGACRNIQTTVNNRDIQTVFNSRSNQTIVNNGDIVNNVNSKDTSTNIDRREPNIACGTRQSSTDAVAFSSSAFPADAVPVKYCFDCSRIELYEEAIQRLLDKYQKYIDKFPDFNETVSENANEYLELQDLKKEIFGSLPPMSREEYMRFYKETGIDIDGRRELMLQLLPQVEHSIRQHIEFAKAIPGFKDLSVKDQIGLVKTTRTDFFHVGRHRSFCPERKLFSPGDGKVLHLDDMIKICPDYSDVVFNFQKKLKDLNMSNTETALMSALCIMFTDNCDLEDSDLVESSQCFLLECLFYVFYKNSSRAGERFSRFISCLTELRTLREMHYKCEEQVITLWEGLINFPPLLCELWSH